MFFSRSVAIDKSAGSFILNFSEIEPPSLSLISSVYSPASKLVIVASFDENPFGPIQLIE